jgi:hypothetical protein
MAGPRAVCRQDFFKVRQTHLGPVAGNQAGDSITAAAIAFGAGYIEEDQSAAMDFGKGNCSGGHIPSVCGH